jgi:D-lactate dehydrogenase (cytochrome)
MLAFTPVTANVLSELTALVGAENLSTAESERRLHAQDMSGHAPCLPEVVIWPQQSRQVAAVLRLAHERRIPVTPWGVGSSLEGNPIPLYGGILLSLARLNQVVALHADDFQVTVQPGLPYKDLNAYLAPHGLFFPPDPGANATIGGMLANNAAGIRTVKYGACKDNVLKMEVALADGRLIRAGSRSVKQASGYDLLHLFVGSEGTLWVITEATLRLLPVPHRMSAVVASFPDVATAVTAVVAIRGSGLEPAALEFIDGVTAAMLTEHGGADFGRRPTLFMEFHAAHEASLQWGLAEVTTICRELGVNDIRTTADPTERQKLWRARHHLFETQVRLHPGRRWLILDVAVPLSAYPALVAFVRRELERTGFVGYMVGHAGDGNLHVTLPFTDETSYRAATAVNAAIVYKAIDLGGTATGEHGVGIGKRDYMVREHGTAVTVMQAIKQMLDPHGILNPGKVLPAAKRNAA